jgi:hypothetical protein
MRERLVEIEASYAVVVKDGFERIEKCEEG